MSYVKDINKPSLILGYTTRRHLLLDLDDTTYIKASNLVNKIMREWPEVGDCLIVFSSKGRDYTYLKYDNYQRPYHKRDRLNLHLVFDSLIGYNKVCKICETLAGLFLINKGYNDIRKFRGDLTLRVSERVERKGVKPVPSIISRKSNPYYSKKDGYIKKYVEFLGFARNLRFLDLEAKSESNNTRQGRNHRAKGDTVKALINRV